MAKSTSIEQYIAILKTIQRFANGGSLKEIGAALTPPMLERDLRECVNALTDEGRVIRDGSYKLSTYRLAPGGLSGLEPEPNQPDPPTNQPAGKAESAAARAESPAGRSGVGDPGYNKVDVAGLGEAGRPGVGARVPTRPELQGNSGPVRGTGAGTQGGWGQPPPPTPVTDRGYSTASARQTPYVAAPPAARPAPPPPPPPAPPEPQPEPPARVVTDEERARFKDYLDQVVPAIVRTEMRRSDARFYASQVAEGLPPGDDDWFKEVIEAELNALDQATSAAYGIAPAAFKKWRARW